MTWICKISAYGQLSMLPCSIHVSLNESAAISVYSDHPLNWTHLCHFLVEQQISVFQLLIYSVWDFLQRIEHSAWIRINRSKHIWIFDVISIHLNASEGTSPQTLILTDLRLLNQSSTLRVAGLTYEWENKISLKKKEKKTIFY